MTQEELKEHIQRLKIEAFDRIARSQSIDPKACGYASHEHMALQVILRHAAEIEKAIRKFERENPR